MIGSHASRMVGDISDHGVATPAPDNDASIQEALAPGDPARVQTANLKWWLKWWQAVRALLAAQFEPAEAQNVRRNALVVFSIRVMSAALLFVSQIILARWIGASGYGLYVALWSAVLVAGGLAHLGLSTAMMRLVPHYRAAQDFAHLRGVLMGGRLIAFGGGLTAAAVGGAALWFSNYAGSPGFAWAAVLALACLPAYALTEAQDGLGRGQGWTLEAIAPPYILRPTLILLGAASVYALSFPATAVTAMACALTATWLTAIVQSALVHRRILETVPAGPAAFAFPMWLKVSLPLLAVSGSELVLQNADVLLLTALRPPEEVGIYYAAAKTTCLALFVHYAVGSAYSGRFATAGALGDRDGLARLAREAVWWTFWPSLGVTVAVLTAGPFLLGLFGKDFQGAYPAMFILSAGLMARAATGPSEFILNMLGHQRDCARSFAIAAAVSICLNLALIPFFGTFGAAAATACAFATASGLNWRTARRKLGLNLFVFARDLHSDVPGPLIPVSSGGPLSATLLRTGDFRTAANSAGVQRTPSAAAVPNSAAPETTRQAITFDIVRDEAAFDALQPDWDRLYAAASGTPQPFMSFAWNRHWLRHYHAGQSHPMGVQLAVVVGRRAGRAAVIWPLATKRMAGMTYLYWMGQPVSQYGDVLVEQSDDTPRLLQDSWDVIVSHLAPDVITLRKVRADAAVAALLKVKCAEPVRTEQAPFACTGGVMSFSVFEERYSAKARKNRRRLLRRLEEQGTVEFVHLSGGLEAIALVKQAIEFKQAWLDARGLLSAAVHDQRFERFFVAACEGATEPPCCLVSALKLNGKPCAVMVSAVGRDRLCGHIFAYDLEHEKAGAGVLLLEECLRYSVAKGIAVFDLMAPGDAYKFDWCEQHVEVHDWALASSLRGNMFTRLYLSHMRDRVKHTAKLLPAPVRRILRRVVQRGSVPGAAVQGAAVEPAAAQITPLTELIPG